MSWTTTKRYPTGHERIRRMEVTTLAGKTHLYYWVAANGRQYTAPYTLEGMMRLEKFLRPGGSDSARLSKTLDTLDLILKDEVVHVPGPPRERLPQDDYDKPDWLYWILLPTKVVKHGRSHHPKANRLDPYQTLFAEELKFAALLKCPNKEVGERLHAAYKAEYERAGFKVDGFGTELFTPDILPGWEIADYTDGVIVPRVKVALAA